MIAMNPLRIAKDYFGYLSRSNWTLAQLGEYQDYHLKKIVKHAAIYVPYYRDLFKKIDLNPSDFSGRSDMEKIPFLDKEIIRKQKEKLIADNVGKRGFRWDSTSGSTGTPLHLLIDDASFSNKLTALWRSYHWAGWKFGSGTFSLQSYYQGRPFDFNPIYRVFRFDSIYLDKKTCIEAAEKLNRLKPKIMMGFPFDYMMLANFATEAGIKLHAPAAMITYGETLSDWKREFLEEKYSCKIFDYYSHHENVAMISECKNGQKHLIEDFAYHEIIGEDRLAISSGEGELVGTGLYNYGMPLIRYKTGDSVVISENNSSCNCGISFRNIERLNGKMNDYLVTPDGRFLEAVMSHSVDQAKGVVMSQCIQDAVDHIDVNMIVDDSFDQDSESAFEAGLRKRIGHEIKLDFHKVDQLIKRNGGKTPFILSKIGNEFK